MEKRMKEKLEKLEEELKQIVTLSENEKEQITSTFEGLKLILETTLDVILALNREEAYRYTSLFVAGFMKIDTNYIEGIKVSKEDKSSIPSKPVPKPDFISFVNNLEPRQRAIIKQLDCYKGYQDPEIGDAIICPDCSPEKMLTCIQAADPAIDPNNDFKIDLELERKRD